MQRRRLLATAGTVVGTLSLSGCSALSSSEGVFLSGIRVHNYTEEVQTLSVRVTEGSNRVWQDSVDLDPAPPDGVTGVFLGADEDDFPRDTGAYELLVWRADQSPETGESEDLTGPDCVVCLVTVGHRDPAERQSDITVYESNGCPSPS